MPVEAICNDHPGDVHGRSDHDFHYAIECCRAVRQMAVLVRRDQAQVQDQGSSRASECKMAGFQDRAYGGDEDGETGELMVMASRGFWSFQSGVSMKGVHSRGESDDDDVRRSQLGYDGEHKSEFGGSMD